ncbi:GroES-like protein [Aspergillus heterothallicus]
MTATKFQKALVVQAIGNPLRLVQRPIPVPEPGWVLVKVAAAGINPHDQKGRDFALFIEPYLPHAILAQDIAGTVVSLGEGVTAFTPGDRIFGQSNVLGGPDQGGLQEYALLHADYAARIPENLTFDDAATIPVNAVASFVALFHSSGLVDYSHDAIVVIGGGSNTGKFGLMFAKLAGFGKVITIAGGTRDSRKMEYLRSLGATHVIDRRLTYLEIEREIRDLVGDSLVYVYDTVNTAASQDLGLTLLSNSREGTLITLLKGRDDTALANKGGYRKAQVLGVSRKHAEFAREFWRQLPGWIRDGTVESLGEVDVIEGLDVEKVNRVLDAYRDGKTVRKTHVHPDTL